MFLFDWIYVEIGGRVDGALGDVRERGRRGSANANRWLLQSCEASGRDQRRKGGSSIVECGSDDDVSKIYFVYLFF